MRTDAHGFELDRKGKIKVSPLMGYTLAPVQGMFCIAKLDYAPTADDLRRGRTKSVQLTMTPAQLRQLSEALLRKAEQLESEPIQSGRN